MRYFINIYAFLTLYCSSISAQPIALKKPLSQEDFLHLDSLAINCIGHELMISFSINSNDFYNDKSIKPSEPSSLKQIKGYEKKLKGNYYDASIYNSIGVVYKRLFLLEEAKTNFDKALDLAHEYVKNNPDCSCAYDILGIVYASLDSLNKAEAVFQKAYMLNNNDSLARDMIPWIYLNTGNFNSYFSEIDKFLKDQPDKLLNYISLFLGLAIEKSSILYKIEKKDIEETLRNKRPDEIIDLSKIKNAFEKNPKKIQYELLYQLSKHLTIYMKSVIRTFADSSFSPISHKFILDEFDIAELKKLEKFYLTCLTFKGIPNKYIINKALGNIHLLRGELALAIPYLKRTIEFKPLNKSTFDSNAADDYDNLALTFLWLKDTALYEKTLIRKFKIKPAINPLPEDYIIMSEILFNHNKYQDAIKYSNDALKINPNQKGAFICLSVIDILKQKYKDASQQLEKLYKIDPNNSDYYLLQGICQLHDNNFFNAYYSFLIAGNLGYDPKWIDKEIISKYFVVKK
jgi:tetratricopeptide (TPR) repeat protein